MNLIEKLKEELTKAQKRVGTGRFASKGMVLGLERAIEIVSREDLAQETVYGFIKRTGLKVGDRVTNGTFTWEITKYMDRHMMTHAEFYLKSLPGERTPLVAGASLKVVSIPGLRKAPKQIRVWKFVFQLEGDLPSVTVNYYPDKSDVERSLREQFPKQRILWTKQLDECTMLAEVECEC